MTTLIILGNINQYTFANSIIAANSKSLESLGEALTRIFVIHSVKSQRALHEQLEWNAHLEKNNVDPNIIVESVIDLMITNNPIDLKPTSISVEKFIDHLEFIIKGSVEHFNLLVDLTNGTTQYKNILSTASYILDIKYQFMIDIDKLFSLTKNREFIDVELLNQSYIRVPDITQLDNIAYLNLAEMIRYRNLIEQRADSFDAIGKGHTDLAFFKNNLYHSIDLKLKGDKSGDKTISRISASSMAASTEEIINSIWEQFVLVKDRDVSKRKTFGQKLDDIQLKLENIKPENFDMDFLERFNRFIVYLRNSAVHKESFITSFENVKADLLLRMSFPFIDFYTEVIHPLLSQESSGKTGEGKRQSDNASEDIFYFGLDGDNTGAILEGLFLSSSSESGFRKLSKSIVKSIEEIEKIIRKQLAKGEIIFAAGDDVLFKGVFDEALLGLLQRKYQDTTSGLTCSIGYGRSFQEVYLALKLAKSKPGKNSIMGINLQ